MVAKPATLGFIPDPCLDYSLPESFMVPFGVAIVDALVRLSCYCLGDIDTYVCRHRYYTLR